MKEILFDIGDKVVKIQDGKLRKCTIKNVYFTNPPIFAIEFEDGTVEKARRADIAPEPKVETPKETEPVIKSEITITPDEFKEITIRIIAEETKCCKALGVALASIMGKIHKALFVESEN